MVSAVTATEPPIFTTARDEFTHLCVIVSNSSRIILIVFADADEKTCASECPFGETPKGGDGTDQDNCAPCRNALTGLIYIETGDCVAVCSKTSSHAFTPNGGTGHDANDCVQCQETNTNLKFFDGARGCKASCKTDGEAPNSDGICAACGEDAQGNQLYADHVSNECRRKHECPSAELVNDKASDCGNFNCGINC